MSTRSNPDNLFGNEPSDSSFGCETIEELAFFRKYDLLKCVYWIIFNGYKTVCLQFPDDMLEESVSICSVLEKRAKMKLYILADTTFGSCCVDYIAAKHINADAIIHFGYACLSASHEIPTLYVFPKGELNVAEASNCIISFASKCSNTVIILYDISFAHYVVDLESSLCSVRNKVRLSVLTTPQQRKDVVKFSSNDILVEKLGRCFSIPATENLDAVVYIYLAHANKRKNLDNFVLTSQNVPFYCYYNDKPDRLEKQTPPVVLKRRSYEIERIKEASRIGILISTLSTDKYIEIVDKIKNLCKLAKKRSYIFSVGKISVEKLANFPEINVFVLVGCPEAEIENKNDYYQPIVGVTELEIALNNNNVLWQNVIKDYREFLPGGKFYKEIDENDFQKANIEADVSLLSNSLICNAHNVTELSENAVATCDPLTVSKTNIDQGLEGRSWRGLEPAVGKTPVEKISVGRKGIPSTGYEHPSSIGPT